MTDETSAGARAPAGLGGWLWPVTWATAVLPVFLTASVVAHLPSIIEYTLGPGDIYPYDQPWVHREIGVHVLLTLVSWWWALHWFARDPHLPRRGPIMLLSSGMLIAGVAWIDHRHTGHPMFAGILLSLAIAGFIFARWSKRIRNTFVPGTLPAHADAFDTAVLGGPRDWSRGYWLLPGALAYAVFGLFSEWVVLVDVASQALPPPYPEGPPHDGCVRGLGFATMGNVYSVSQIEAHREALTISHAAGLMLLGAVVGFVRGARWTLLAAIAALALAMAAPLRITLGEWCSPFVDGPDFREMWREWCVALILVTLAACFRYWPASKKRT
ncbi:MAG: hypothetical protein JNM58_10570 [Xanthomonadaceae bacterium]|nr:hypothetical protein [Xanthomonadaceae bacterium]